MERQGIGPDINRILNIVVLVVSAAVMLIGVLAMVGLLIPVYIPQEYRILVGAVVFLYGMYRFVIAYNRMKRRDR